VVAAAGAGTISTAPAAGGSSTGAGLLAGGAEGTCEVGATAGNSTMPGCVAETGAAAGAGAAGAAASTGVGGVVGVASRGLQPARITVAKTVRARDFFIRLSKVVGKAPRQT